jgi:Notch-like protein
MMVLLVLLLSSSNQAQALQHLIPLHPFDAFGTAVASLGDVDGDGVIDIAVGASLTDDGDGVAGALYICFLNSNGTVKSEQKINNMEGGLNSILSGGGRFGISVASLGYFDDDTVTDIVVGASEDYEVASNAGAVFVLCLHANGTVKHEQKIPNPDGAPVNDYFGTSVASLGDLNQDGIPDIVVGAFGDADGGSFGMGAVYILFLHANGALNSQQKISNAAGNKVWNSLSQDYFGRAVASIGDVDNDGVIDIVVGAYQDSVNQFRGGALYILFLNSDGTVHDEQRIAETEGGLNATVGSAGLGWSVASLGDLDNDTVTDIVVGARLDDDGFSNAGAAYVLFLNTDGTVKAEQKISYGAGGLDAPLSSDANFGQAVAFLGDFNNDSVADLLVGSNYNHGAVHLLTMTPMGHLDTCTESYCVDVNAYCTFDDLTTSVTGKSPGDINRICPCSSGWEGLSCELDIDDCASAPCNATGTSVCTDEGTNSYSCTCKAGYTGTHCEINIDDCAPAPCHSTGTDFCTDGIDTYSCTCNGGFTGNHCTTNIDDCVACDDIGTESCVDGVVAFTCTCKTGFTGGDCAINVDDCAAVDACGNNGACTDGVNNYTCACNSGFTGTDCEVDIPDCPSVDPCNNHGACTDGIDSYSCTCDTGFTGTDCEVDIPDCPSVDPCNNHGACTDGIDSYSCTCDTGFTGMDCDSDIDDCASSPCVNGTCSDDGSVANSYNCTCDNVEYTGIWCNVTISDIPDDVVVVSSACDSSPCLNEGICEVNVTVGGFDCLCIPESNTTGVYCGIVLDLSKEYITMLLSFTVNGSPQNASSVKEIEDSVLATLLLLQPGSVSEQYIVAVTLENGEYEIEIGIASTAEVSAQDIHDSIVADSSGPDTAWVVVESSTRTGDDDAGEAVDAQEDDLLIVIVIIALAFALFVSVGCGMYMYNKKSRKEVTDASGKNFVMPI